MSGKIVYYCAYCGAVSDQGFIQKCRACSGMDMAEVTDAE